jgi:uncharacterized protein YodC (DUF2158 family)
MGLPFKPAVPRKRKYKEDHMIKVGDVVRLKSGGLPMTVTWVYASCIGTAYFNSEEDFKVKDSIPVECIELVE